MIGTSSTDPYVLAAWVGAIAAGVVALPVAIKPFRRPFRWVWRRLVHDPIDLWFRTVVGNEVRLGTEPIKGDLAHLHECVETIRRSAVGAAEEAKDAALATKATTDRIEAVTSDIQVKVTGMDDRVRAIEQTVSKP